MGKIFLTSDLHFGHERSFLYEPRGYDSIAEHDEDIIRIWNETVSNEDTAYILGDIMLNDNEHGMECLSQLNGTIKIVLGNHDTDTRRALYETLPNVEVLGYATMIRYRKYNIYLSHYPARTSNYDDGVSLHRKVLSFCGHSHTSDRFADWDDVGAYHVEWDAHGRPVGLDSAISEIRDKIAGYYEPSYLMPLLDNTAPMAIQPSAFAMEDSFTREYSDVRYCFNCVYNIWPKNCDYNYNNINHDCGYYKPIGVKGL